MADFSIIVPHKGKTDLLRRALASIPLSPRIEVIVVDDASDLTQEEKDNYPGLDREGCRVIFTTEAGGAGFARNVGLRHATGKWLLFMDSDDFFLESCLRLLEKHYDDPSDLVCFRCTSVWSDSGLPSPRLDKRNAQIDRYKDRPALLEYYNRYFHTEPWGKMVRRKLLEDNGILFEESLCANDYLFSVLTGFHANSVSYDDEPLYCVTLREGSLSWEVFDDPVKLQTRLAVYWNVQSFFREKGIRIYPFYKLWEMTGLSKDARLSSQADAFLRSKGVPRLRVFAGWFCFALRRKLRIGVPYRA